ncbi:MAG TPA: putative methyltransferase [Thermoplasmatales archaeon]|nr:putative methyltransferase [Thermoplasmatales archaeon]
MKALLNRVKETTTIPVSERSIENIFAAMLGSSEFWKIVDISEEPLPLVASVISILNGMGYVELGDKITLTEKGKRFIMKTGIYPRHDFTCKSCGGRGIEKESFSMYLDRFKELVKNRPIPKHEFDQAFVTPETVMARVMLMHSRGDLANREIFVIGDDDLTSVAMMLTGLPKKIVVLDIDRRLIDFIDRLSNEIGFTRIELFTFDVRERLPDYIYRKFDVFITDPPETIYAIKAFIGRGIASLKGAGCAGYCGITRRESSLEKWREMERILVSEFNVVITDIIRNFNEYVNWGYEEETRAWRLTPIKSKPSYNWYKSYMIRIQTLPNSRGFEDRIDADKELYEDAESSTT